MSNEIHPAVLSTLAWFDCDHLPAHLREIVAPFRELAHGMAGQLEGAELTYGLRELLAAKDCMVRARVAMERKGE